MNYVVDISSNDDHLRSYKHKTSFYMLACLSVVVRFDYIGVTYNCAVYESSFAALLLTSVTNTHSHQ